MFVNLLLTLSLNHHLNCFSTIYLEMTIKITFKFQQSGGKISNNKRKDERNVTIYILSIPQSHYIDLLLHTMSHSIQLSIIPLSLYACRWHQNFHVQQTKRNVCHDHEIYIQFPQDSVEVWCSFQDYDHLLLQNNTKTKQVKCLHPPHPGRRIKMKI